MKKLLSIFLLLQFFGIQADWVIVTIDNQSDLQLTQAARTDQNVEIQSISKKIQKPKDTGQISLHKKEMFGTQGQCKIIAQNPKGDNVTLIFLGDPTNRVANGRAQYADSRSRAIAGLNNKGMMARVMLEELGTKKLIGYYCGYEKDNQPFKLVLHGFEGDYKVTLVPVIA